MNKSLVFLSILYLTALSAVADLNTDLIRAADRGDLEVVTSLLKEGADPKAQDSDALIGAAASGKIEVVKVLLENGADAKGQNSDALVKAATLEHADIVKLLLEYGADPKAQDSKAFVNAVSDGNIEIIKLLVQNGADLGISDKLYNEGRKDSAMQFDKNYLMAMPDNIDQVVNKWTERGEDALALDLKNNPRIAIQVLDKLINSRNFPQAEEYGNKMLEYWVAQSPQEIRRGIDIKLKFAISMNSDFYYDALKKAIVSVDPNYVVENYEKYLESLPLNANVKDLSITDFLVHRSYVNQGFLDKYNLSLEDARMMLEVDIYELTKKGDIIFSVLHTVALYAKEDPSYKLHIFAEQPLGKGVAGEYVSYLSSISVNPGALRSDAMRQALAHEWTHLLMNLLFQNDSNPFAAKDDQARIAWEKTMEIIWDKVNKAKDIDPASLYGRAIRGYVAVKKYPESQYGSEMIARLPTILASEIYNDPQVKEFLKPIYDYWMQFIEPAIQKYVKEHAKDDTFISDWERENISDPFYRAKLEK